MPLFLSLVTVPLYLRLVGVERYGVLQIAWLLLGYFGLFDLGLGRATAFRIAAQRDAPASVRAQIFWSALTVNLAMGLVGCVVLWLVAGRFLVAGANVSAALRVEMLLSVPLLALAVPIATATGVLTGALQGRECFRDTNIISASSTALFQLLPLSVAALHVPYLPHLLIAAIGARAVALVWLALLCRRELTRSQHIRVDSAQIRALLGYGGWVTLSSVFGPMLVIVDRFAMSAVLGMSAVAIYSIPYNMASRIAVLPSALTNALFPRLSAAQADEARAMSAQAARVLMSLISLPVLLAVLLAGPLLQLWVGATLGAAAAPVARVLLLAFWFNALALVPFTRLQARGRPDLVTKLLIVQILPYWVLLYVSMHYFGLIGCAVAFLIRLIADFVLQSLASDRRIAYWPQLVCYVGLLTAALLWTQVSDPREPIWYVGVLLLLGLCLLLSWRNVAPLIANERAVRREAVARAA